MCVACAHSKCCRYTKHDALPPSRQVAQAYKTATQPDKRKATLCTAVPKRQLEPYACRGSLPACPAPPAPHPSPPSSGLVGVRPLVVVCLPCTNMLRGWVVWQRLGIHGCMCLCTGSRLCCCRPMPWRHVVRVVLRQGGCKALQHLRPGPQHGLPLQCAVPVAGREAHLWCGGERGVWWALGM